MNISYSVASKKLPIKQLSKHSHSITPEQRYWSNFKHPIISKYPSSINDICFSLVDPYEFAITTGTVVHIYDPKLNDIKKTISQFKQTVRCVCYRNDGKLLLAGGDDKKIQLFNISSRGILRQFKDHKGSIEDVKFVSDDNTQIVSVSEDKTLRLFDIPSENIIHTFKEHKDYVKCVRVSPSSSNIIGTCSYDHTIKLWDLRSKHCISSYDYNNPVEKFQFFPTGNAIAACSGCEIILRDTITGKIIKELKNHQKTVTSLCFDGSGSRLFSSSLDHQVKIYDLDSYQVSHSIKYTAPILNLGISKNNSHLVVGMSDGTLSIRKKESLNNNNSIDNNNISKFHSASHRHITQEYSSSYQYEPDYEIKSSTYVRFKSYEQYLRRFMYKEALDRVLATNDVCVIISLIEELVYRKALRNALDARDNQELLPILLFLEEYILNPRYNTHLFIVFNIILDLYASVLGRSPDIDEIILRIQNLLSNEINLQEQMFSLLGSLEMIMTTKTLYNK